jgi:hypothetical protein
MRTGCLVAGMMIAPDSITSSAAETGVPERNVLDVVLKLKYDKHG